MKRKKRLLIEMGILLVIFIVAVAVFSHFTNRGNDSMTADMGSAAYPQVSFSYNGYTLNSLPAYAQEMDIPSMRDSITPVVNGRLEMNIKAYENKIKSAECNVYTLDGSEKLSEETVKEPGEEVTLDISGGNVLEEERVLQIVLHTEEDKKVYYYTRIKDSADTNLSECLDYIREFHENTLVKAEGVGIGTAIEPSDEGDNTTLQHVTIHSDYNHVTWGELEPEVEGGERWSIKELNGTYTSVQLEYQVRCKGEENEEDEYKVKEFYRVRHLSNAKKTYLLDYDRQMEQIFNPVQKVLSEKGVLLGIADSDIPYMVNKDGTVVAFVQADELWSYNRDSDEVSLVFSFASAEGSDERNLISQHEIKLLEAEGSGNITFAVCGYMNRGEHEGEVGIAVYYYDMEKSSVEEKVFIATDKSYGHTVLELGKLIYYSADTNTLYALIEGNLYEIDVEKEKKKTLVEGLKENQYIVSDDGHLVAYQTQENASEATEIIVKNLATGKERTVECADGECVQPLGFIENDFVYGVAKTDDVGQSVSGETVIPMYKIEIQNSKSKIVKTYQQEKIYVLDAQFDDSMVTLKRASKKGNTYTGIIDDYITNNEAKDESNIYLESYVTELKETQRRLTFNDGISDKEPKILKPKQVLFENPVTITFDDVKREGKYYVYGHGELRGIYDKAGEAIQKANEYNGVVVSEEQEYIWERGNRDLQYSIPNDSSELRAIRSQLDSGASPMEVMEKLSDGNSLDLTGCTTEELLYVVNQGSPVIAMKDADSAVLLVGYSESTVTYMDIASGERHSVSYKKMDDMTKGSGHTYVGKIKDGEN